MGVRRDAIYYIRFFHMQEDLNIAYPAQTDCLLHKDSDTYSCQIPITNHSNTPLYFHIASTFGLFLKENTSITHLPPTHTTTLSFTFRSTNIISHTHEFISISISSSRISQLCALANAQRVKVQLRFTENFVDDPMIEQIVGEEARHLLIEGHKLREKGKFSEARIKYEESFQLLRKCDEALFGMAWCSLQLKEWSGCLRDIETALLISPGNAHYQLLKMKALIWCYGSCKTWEGEVMEQCYKALNNIQITKKGVFSPEEQNQLKKLIASIEDNPLLNRTRMLKKEVIAKALAKYSEIHPIAKWYSKAELNCELREVLLSDEVQENATPEEIIDPISYEIMSAPFILQSGHSFEQRTLQQYFQKNGFKDPITRKDIYPQFVFPNLNLRDFIREHPKLKIWRQYEHDLVYK